jgi:hypothetical protein
MLLGYLKRSSLATLKAKSKAKAKEFPNRESNPGLVGSSDGISESDIS